MRYLNPVERGHGSPPLHTPHPYNKFLLMQPQQQQRRRKLTETLKAWRWCPSTHSESIEPWYCPASASSSVGNRFIITCTDGMTPPPVVHDQVYIVGQGLGYRACAERSCGNIEIPQTSPGWRHVQRRSRTQFVTNARYRNCCSR